MNLDDTKILKERVNLRAFITIGIVVFLGSALLYLSANEEWWKNHKVWQTVIRDTGGLLLVTVAVTILWSLWGKRAFLDEVLTKAQISKEIMSAGIVKITDTFHDRSIDWNSYFHTVQKLDIFFAYGRTWRKTHLDELRKVAAKKDARIRVVLPDPEDTQTVLELARRFNFTPEALKGEIREAEAEFRKLCLPEGATVNIWFLPAAPLFTFYRFDHIAILALYSHRPERFPIPTFVCEMGGTLYDYVRKEFDAMIIPEGLARLITGEEEKSIG